MRLGAWLWIIPILLFTFTIDTLKIMGRGILLLCSRGLPLERQQFHCAKIVG